MKCVILLVLTLVLFQTSAPAQTDKSSCPKFSMGAIPPYAFRPGDSVDFKVRFDGDYDASKLSYVWTAYNGKILRGQGTQAATAKPDYPTNTSLTVTVKIQGFPENCPNTAAESMSIDSPPLAVKISEYGKTTHEKEVLELEKFAGKLRIEPNSSAFITKSFAPNSSRKNAYKKSQQILEYLESLGVDRERIRFLLNFDGEGKTRFFIIPPGASDPESDGEILDAAKLAAKLKSAEPARKKIKRPSNK